MSPAPDGYSYLIDQNQGLESITDRVGNTTFFTNGQITTATVSGGSRSINIVRNPATNEITSIKDPTGQSVTYGYDGSNNLTSVTDRDGNTTTIDYDPSHLLLHVHDPRGYTPATNTYDVSGRLLTTTDASGNSVQYFYNLAANTTKILDRLNNETDLTYDSLGNVTSKTQWLAPTHGVTTMSVFTDSNNPQLPTEVIDPLGHETDFAYDANGHATSTARHHKVSGVDTPLVTTSAYDPNFGSF